MKKIFAVIMLFSVAGCIAKEKFTFNQGLFSIVLPAPFETSDSTIEPQNDGDFPLIKYRVSDVAPGNSLLSIEEGLMENLCNQTDSCGQIIDSEEVNIGDIDGLKFASKYKGRSIDDLGGYILEYHYTFQNNGTLFRFWISTNDLEDPTDKAQVFEEIMESFILQYPTSD